MSAGNGTSLAERGKQKISAAEAIELVKKFVKDRHKADKTRSDNALAEANNFAGGASERLDKATIDFGRQWAVRLALIARQTSGSGYQASKSGSAIAGVVKKVFAIVGELESMLATDVEIGLFDKVKDEDYFGYGRDFKSLSVKDFTKHADPGETFDQAEIVERIADFAGEKVQDEIVELLDQYEIESVVAPGEPENEDVAEKKPRRRRK